MNNYIQNIHLLIINFHHRIIQIQKLIHLRKLVSNCFPLIQILFYRIYIFHINKINSFYHMRIYITHNLIIHQIYHHNIHLKSLFHLHKLVNNYCLLIHNQLNTFRICLIYIFNIRFSNPMNTNNIHQKVINYYLHIIHLN